MSARQVNSRSSRSNQSKGEKILKIVITGDPKVGKTSLRRTFMGKAFKQNYLPTLGADFSLYIMNHRTYTVKTTLWDLSGQPKFGNVHPQYYIGSHAAIVLYDVLTEDPANTLINWIDTYLEFSNRFGGPILIIQNKIDLQNEQDFAYTNQEHEKLIEKIQIYYGDKTKITSARTSAKTGENVDISLQNFIRDVTDHYLKATKNRLTETHYDPQIEHVIASYLITFENQIGPIIVAKSPEQENLDYSDGEEVSVVHLSAGLNMEELVEQQYETATFLWSEPTSLLYYVAFVIPNEQARGGHDLYIIGCNVSRDFKNLLADERNMIDGFLLSAMNKFNDFMGSYQFNLSDQQDILRLHQSPIESKIINELLHNLREEVENLIKDTLA